MNKIMSQLEKTFIAQAGKSLRRYGDVVIKKRKKLVGPSWFRNLTIKRGANLEMNGYRVFVKNKLTYNA